MSQVNSVVRVGQGPAILRTHILWPAVQYLKTMNLLRHIHFVPDKEITKVWKKNILPWVFFENEQLID